MAINDAIGQQQAPQAMPQDQAQLGQAPVGEEAATPEEQEAYDKVVMAGIKALSDPKTTPKVIAMLGNDDGGDPAKRLAATTSAIFGQLDEQSGGKIPEVVIIPAASELLENVAEFASESGAVAVDDAMVGRAAQFLIADIGEAYGFDEEDFAALSEGMSEQDIQALVQEQDAIARSGPEGEQQSPQAVPQAQPQIATPSQPVSAPQPAKQELPGIINQVIGG